MITNERCFVEEVLLNVGFMSAIREVGQSKVDQGFLRNMFRVKSKNIPCILIKMRMAHWKKRKKFSVSRINL